MAYYLVTGGCGFIGSHLVRALVHRGHNVRILDDLSTGQLVRCHPAVDLIRGSVTDEERVRDAVNGVNGCFHLAAVASVPRCNRELAACHRVNIGGFVNLLDAVRMTGHKIPIVYASSAAVYGRTESLASDRSSCPAPVSHYGSDKLACEHHGLAAHESCGICSIGLRFFNVYGPGQDLHSPYSGVISIFLDAVSGGRPIHIFGDGHQIRDFVFVDDVVEAQLLAMEHLNRQAAKPKGEQLPRVYNVCTGCSTSVRELAEAVSAAVGHKPEIRYGPPRTGDIHFSVGSTEAAAFELGFMARTPLAHGLRMVAATMRVAV
jgi:UDP-glucose 4-epimerase